MSTHEAPLAGVKVLDISTYVAGPSCAMTLSQLGAEVTRIDPPGGASDTRRLPFSAMGRSIYWATLNRGKRSIEVNTRNPQGQELVGNLLASQGPEGGIVVTNTVGHSGVSYDELKAWREDLIMVHILGHADGRPAVDYTINSEVGFPMITGSADDTRPVNHVLPAWDLLAGLQGVIAVLSALKVRERTGKGQYITVSLADVAATTAANLGMVAEVVINNEPRQRDGNYTFGLYGHDFKTADGGHVMTILLTPKHWYTMVELTGTRDAFAGLSVSMGLDFDDEVTRYKYRRVSSALFGPWFEQRSFAEATRALADAKILWGPYRSVEDFVRSPESPLAKSGLFEDVYFPEIGTVPTPRAVLRFDEDVVAIPRAKNSPGVGTETNDVLHTDLGLDDEAIAALRAAGVIGGS
jgi:2-methylfumaryl-CoA isomerase